MALVFIMHIKAKWARQRSKETDSRTKLVVLQAMKVRAHNGVVTQPPEGDAFDTPHFGAIFWSVMELYKALSIVKRLPFA